MANRLIVSLGGILVSSIKEWADQKAEEAEYRSFLERLIEADEIKDKAAAGITKQVIAEGEASLSGKQTYVFDEKVKKVFAQPRCEQCGDLIPWSQAYEHIHSPGLCASCQHTYHKFMAEK
ncbi:hypothetical protein LOF12_13935 [Sinorhizobium meliloti]|uniref:hypothetical protein n=1 Tax=Rhizobium meliloti TaxID=382 RepID=UPI00035FA4E8|nr:hypothetical protein [Sinorhizobium meliloti]MDE4602438.1 hypothetical protein [Sinorhizobium meliloti]